MQTNTIPPYAPSAPNRTPGNTTHVADNPGLIQPWVHHADPRCTDTNTRRYTDPRRTDTNARCYANTGRTNTNTTRDAWPRLAKTETRIKGCGCSSEAQNQAPHNQHKCALHR
jgi:hypothetical protein